jgi:hypothetical protein
MKSIAAATLRIVAFAALLAPLSVVHGQTSSGGFSEEPD